MFGCRLRSYSGAVRGRTSAVVFPFVTLLAGMGLLAQDAAAETFQMSPGDDYTVLEAAQPGDIVEIAPGTYQFRVHLTAEGDASNPIIIRAADPSDPPVWDLDGMNVNAWPGSYTGGDNDRGGWMVRGGGYEISGIVFRNSHNAGGNAAGLRTIGSTDVTLRDVLFEGNDVGLSGEGEGTLVEFSEFVGNGQQSNPPQHSIYIYGGSLHLRHNYIHDSAGGQNLHIRARDAVIEYNWIARAQNYEADIMTGDDPEHTMVFRGNVVVGNTNPENGGRVFVLHNDTGAPGISMNIQVLWNTFYLQSGTNPAIVAVSNNTLESASVEISNNIIVGTNRAVSVNDEGLANTTISGTHNWFPTGADIGPLEATVFGDDPGFRDAAALDFRLLESSAAIGAADETVPDGPQREYFESEDNPLMFRWRSTAADLGAFEFNTEGPGYGPYDDPREPPPPGGTSGGEETTGGDDSTGGTPGGSTGGAETGAVPGTGTATGEVSSSGSTPPGETDGEAASDADDGGCGCRSGSSSGWGALVLLGLLGLRRRD